MTNSTNDKDNKVLVIRNPKTNQKLPPISATIGNFDGLHLGHEKLIENTVEQAKNLNLKSAIITFEPHPALYFNKNLDKNFKIFSLSQKLRLLKQKYKVDYVIILNFNSYFANISAPDFIKEILIDNLNIKHLTIGYDFTFGSNKSGNHDLLKQYFYSNIDKIDQIIIQDEVCSSSNIRKYLKNGQTAKANIFLNKNYSITGQISSNKKMGRTIGFNTANIVLKNDTLKPKHGVYESITTIPHLKNKFKSITNFGTRPTIDNSTKEIFETHILNFNQDIYNKKITVELTDFIREEKKFYNIDELKKQISEDIAKINL